MLNKYNLHSHIPLKLLIILTIISSSLLYGCIREKKVVLFWEDKSYYNVDTSREAINNSADKRLNTVTELSAPLFNNSLLIIIPSQEMAIWAKGEKHSNEAIELVLEAGLQMYASAIKKHNMFKTVLIVSSSNRTIDRTAFDYTLRVDGLVPRSVSPMWVIKKTGHNMEMPSLLAIDDYFKSVSLIEAIDKCKQTVIMLNEIISSISEHKNIERFMNENP